jgi:hypothetical protein
VLSSTATLVLFDREVGLTIAIAKHHTRWNRLGAVTVPVVGLDVGYGCVVACGGRGVGGNELKVVCRLMV